MNRVPLFLGATVTSACLALGCAEHAERPMGGEPSSGAPAEEGGGALRPITLDLAPGCNPFATSAECLLPFPSDFFSVADPGSPTGLRVHYPDGVVQMPASVPALDFTRTNQADGSSPAGPILLHFGRDIAPEQLVSTRNLSRSLEPGAAIALYNLSTGERVMFLAEMDMNRKAAYPDRYALILRPMQPMEMGQRHVVVLTRAVTDAQ